MKKVRSIPLIAPIAALLALFTLVELAQAQDQSAPEDFPNFSFPYTQAVDEADNDCRHDATDPINVAFRGRYANLNNTVFMIQNHADWTHFDGSQQWLRVRTSDEAGEYSCRAQGNQRANHGNLWPFGRYHTRLWFIPASLNPGPRTTVGDAHHEDVTYCGHAVDQNGPEGSGFDRGRQELSGDYFDAGHRVTHDIWGNSRTFEQCDGGDAGSNGVGDFIGMGHPPHSRD